MDRPSFPELHYFELQRIVRQEPPELAELAGSVGSDWLDDADAEALADVALSFFFGHQLGPDSESLPTIDILGDDIAALVQQQRRSFWEETPPTNGQWFKHGQGSPAPPGLVSLLELRG